MSHAKKTINWELCVCRLLPSAFCLLLSASNSLSTERESVSDTASHDSASIANSHSNTDADTAAHLAPVGRGDAFSRAAF